MRWVAKAVLQKGLGALPRAERVNYLLQRHVTRSLPAPEHGFRRKFARAARHLDAYERHGPERPLAEAIFYEFGAGWDLAVPLSYWSLGVERQLLVDQTPNLRLPLVNVSVERLDRLAAELAAEAEREPRTPGSKPLASLGELEARFGITYLAPRDARRTGLPSSSVDFVSSTNTLEHIPADDVVPLLAECRRLLRPDGVVSCLIDLSDHFSHFDDSISRYNFLRYSEGAWRMINSGLLHQNRLRRPDYLSAFQAAGLGVVAETAWRPRGKQVDALRRLEPAARFRRYDFEDLAVQLLTIVARPTTPSPDAAKELEHVGG